MSTEAVIESAPTPISAPVETTPVGLTPRGDSILGGESSPEKSIQENHWSHKLSEEGLRGHKSLLNFKSADEAVKAYVGVQPMIGADKAPIPKDWNDPKQVDDYAMKMGRPVDPKGYDLGDISGLYPEGFRPDDALIENFKGLAFKNALSPTQFKTIAQEYIKRDVAEKTAAYNKAIGEQEMRLDKYKSETGSKYAEEEALANNALREFCDQDGELRQLMKDRNMDREPAMIKAFAKIGKMIMEDSGRLGGAGSSKHPAFFADTPDAARAQIAEFKNSAKADILWNPTHPEHSKVVDEWQKLHAKLVSDKK